MEEIFLFLFLYTLDIIDTLFASFISNVLFDYYPNLYAIYSLSLNIKAFQQQTKAFVFIC